MMKIQQHDGMVVEATVISVGLRQALRRRRRCWRREGLHQGKGLAALPPPLPSICRVKGRGGRPPRCI